MLNAILFFCLAVFPWILFPQASILVRNYQIPRAVFNEDSLQQEKLILEIESLNREIKYSILVPIAQLGALFIALLTVIISLKSLSSTNKRQLRALEAQTKQNSQTRISLLLKELGSSQPAVRSAAVQALSKHSSAISFIINLLVNESVFSVISTIYLSLELFPAKSIGKVIDATKFLGERQEYIAIALKSLGEPDSDVKKSTLIPISILRTYKSIPKAEQVERDIQTLLRSTSTRKLVAGFYRESDEILVCSRRLVRAIESLVRKKRSKIAKLNFRNAFLPEIDFSEMSNIENCDFTGAFLAFSRFDSSICKGSRFDKAIVTDSSFRNTSLHDSYFINAILDNSDFGKSRLIRVNMSGSRGVCVKFKGSKFYSSNFNGCVLPECNFSGAIGVSSKFIGTTLFRSKFSDAIINESSFLNADLRGSSLSNIKAKRVDFTEAIFGGNDMRNSRFDGSNFVRAIFFRQRDYQKASFTNTTLTEIEFKDGSENFREYLRGHFDSSV